MIIQNIRLISNINATPYINDLNVEIYTIDNFYHIVM